MENAYDDLCEGAWNWSPDFWTPWRWTLACSSGLSRNQRARKRRTSDFYLAHTFSVLGTKARSFGVSLDSCNFLNLPFKKKISMGHVSSTQGRGGSRVGKEVNSGKLGNMVLWERHCQSTFPGEETESQKGSAASLHHTSRNNNADVEGLMSIANSLRGIDFTCKVKSWTVTPKLAHFMIQNLANTSYIFPKFPDLKETGLLRPRRERWGLTLAVSYRADK
jgi:hypothetical protein